MKLGINSYTYMWSIGFIGACPKNPLNALALLDKARQLNIQLVQTGPNLPLNTDSIHTFIELAYKNDIELEFGIRGLETSLLSNWINVCLQANARLLRTVPEIDDKTPTMDALVHQLKAIKPHLEESNIWLGLENGSFPCRSLRSAIEQVNSPNIGVVLDMVNSLAVPEGWREVTQILAPITMCLHYKDFSIRRAWHMMGFFCEGRPAGQGQIDPEWLFRTLEKSNYDFNVILELWTPEQAILEDTISLEQQWAEISINFLRNYVKQ